MAGSSARSKSFSSRNQTGSRFSKRQGAIGSAASATLESLESRRLLTVAPILTATGAPTAIEGQDYVLTLSAPASATISNWTIDWGDGTIALPDLQTVLGATSSVLHKYADSTTPYRVTATATDGTNTFTVNAGGGGVTGTPDPGFAASGRLIVSGRTANAVAVQADGKILVVNTGVVGITGGFAVTRYNADGTLDNGIVGTDSNPLDSFGTGGTVITTFGTQSAVPNAITVQSDGKIVVAGAELLFGTPHVAVARYNPDGSLDSTFGTGGIFAQLAIPSNANGAAIKSVVIDNKTGANFGKIVFGGVSGTIGIDGSSNHELFVGRLNANGMIDDTFGSLDTGIIHTGYTVIPGSVSEQGGAIAVQSDDKIIVVGKNLDRASIIRLNVDGSLDTGFNTTGRVATTGVGSFNAVAVDAGGNIVVAGLVADGSGNDQWTVMRFDSAGGSPVTFATVLPSYNRVPPSTTTVSSPSSIAIQPDGKILVSGSTDINLGTSDFATVRYNADGTADTTFGTTGAVVTNFGGVDDIANAMVLLPGGQVIVAGGATLEGTPSFILQQFGITASATPVTVLVAEVGPTVTLINVPANSPEGASISASASIVDFTPANLTSTWTVTKNGTPFTAGTGTAINFVPTDNGTYVLTFTTGDVGGVPAVASATINVINVAPTASVTADAIGAIGVRGQNRHIHIPVATDPSSVDTAAGFAYTVSWGDGTTTPIALTTLASDPGHIYQYNGNYHITVTAADKDNGISAAVALNLAITPVAIEGTTLAIGGLTPYDLLIITQTGNGANTTIRLIDDFLLKYRLNESLFTRIDIYQATDSGTFVASNVTDAVYLVDANGTVIETIHAANPGH